MWFRHAMIRESVYHPETWWLNKRLESGFSPYDFMWLLEDFGIPEEDQETWLESASPDEQSRFKDFVFKELDYDFPMLPPYISLENPSFEKSEWLVHFTNDATDIEVNGFLYGHPEFEDLHLTTWKINRKDVPGFNFAFGAFSRDAADAAQSENYGNSAVLFQSSSVDAYHEGDEESQRIFWGPAVSPSRIYAIHQGIDGGWYVDDYSGRTVFGNEDDDQRGIKRSFSDAVNWVVANHEQLDHVRARIDRKNRAFTLQNDADYAARQEKQDLQ